MGRKLLKKDIVDVLLSTEKQEEVKTEKQNDIMTEKQKDRVKVTLYLSSEEDILIDRIREALNYRRKGRKLSRSDVVARAIREFAEKLGVAEHQKEE